MHEGGRRHDASRRHQEQLRDFRQARRAVREVQGGKGLDLGLDLLLRRLVRDRDSALSLVWDREIDLVSEQSVTAQGDH